MVGKIKMLSERGFGFIDVDGSREANHFFHAKHLADCCFEQLRVGAAVEFESARSEKGLEAHDVRLAN